jgi:hypothetical protein
MPDGGAHSSRRGRSTRPWATSSPTAWSTPATRAGDFFGEPRLVDLLRRETAAGHPPPEALRRLVHAVLDHQAGVLQDDATVVLARWNGRSPN